jgi:hypothetical protein
MDKNKKNITNMKENENKLSLHKLYEIENINSNFFKNAIILKLLDSKELLYVIQEKKDNSQSYLVELYDLINKKVLLTTKLQDIIADIILLDNNDIAYFVSGGAKIEDKLLTVLKGSVQIINISNLEKKIIQCETPELEDHSLFCNLFPITIKDKIGVGVVFDFEIYIFLKTNENEKYENFKKIENFGTLSDYYIYKNYFVSYGFEEFHYYDLDKNFELKTYDKLKSEDINIKTFLLFAKYRMKIQISDHIFIFPFNKKNIIFFDADQCKVINILEIKGNEFNVKSEIEVKQMLFINNYLLLLIQILSNDKTKLVKYSIDEATLGINYISSLDFGKFKENSIFLKKNILYIVKYGNYPEDKIEKLEIYDIDI